MKDSKLSKSISFTNKQNSNLMIALQMSTATKFFFFLQNTLKKFHDR